MQRRHSGGPLWNVVQTCSLPISGRREETVPERQSFLAFDDHGPEALVVQPVVVLVAGEAEAEGGRLCSAVGEGPMHALPEFRQDHVAIDRKSTRLNSSH